MSEVKRRIIKAKEEGLIELDLSGLDLADIPKEVFLLEQLEVLRLSNNRIEELPEDIKHLKNLDHLYLNNNRISVISNELLVNMPFIQDFDLAGNPLNYYKTAEFHLKNNRWFGYKKCLKSIESSIGSGQNSFYYDETIREFPKEIYKWLELSYLSISGKDLKEIPAGIGSLINLRDLSLKGNDISSLPADFGSLENLRSVDLSFNNFKEFPDALLRLPNLVKISINDNNIDYIDRDILKSSKLKLLDGGGNPDNFYFRHDSF